jgi:hypothetical protein
MNQCVCLYYEFKLRKIRYCLFLTITCEYTISYKKIAAHLKPCGGTPVTGHCTRGKFLLKSPANYRSRGEAPNSGPKLLDRVGWPGLSHVTKTMRNEYGAMVEL